MALTKGTSSDVSGDPASLQETALATAITSWETAALPMLGLIQL